ncbi:DNA damage-induced apoptosis suppressor protein-like [Lethenteron reissneri]|uniref:DNA damage-induced apoptosis suppressor protein-like n=1 Tax=Lethenteron reissneri TaxID=7753 RepID=UPI002AB799FE|nr:DNA damage-induced apoptosis suppressor protein-like [Lethenteron reissneri]
MRGPVLAVVLGVRGPGPLDPTCAECGAGVTWDSRDHVGLECARCGPAGVRWRYRLWVTVAVLGPAGEGPTGHGAGGGGGGGGEVTPRPLAFITVFGPCLDEFMGGPAPTFRRAVMSVWRGEGDRGEGAGGRGPMGEPWALLCCATEQFFVGRTFIFGLQPPSRPHRAPHCTSFVASHLWCTQPLPHGLTVLSIVKRLAQVHFH